MSFSPISPVAVADAAVLEFDRAPGTVTAFQKEMGCAVLRACAAQIALEWSAAWYEFGQSLLHAEARVVTLAYGREDARASAHRSAGAAWACHKAWIAYNALAEECVQELRREYREKSDALELAIADAQRFLPIFTPPNYRAPNR